LLSRLFVYVYCKKDAEEEDNPRLNGTTTLVVDDEVDTAMVKLFLFKYSLKSSTKQYNIYIYKVIRTHTKK